MLKFVTTLAAALFIALTPAAYADEAKLNRTITINGTGEVRAVPDMATVMMGVMTTGQTAKEALDLNTKEMQELLALLKAAGIEDRDVGTSNFYVNPRYDYGQGGAQPPKVVGYDVSNTVNVTVRKLDMLGSLLDKGVSSGTNQINGINFMVSQPDTYLDEARKLAVADARRKAELFAAAAGIGLGEIVAIGEGGASAPSPVFTKYARAAASDAPVPVAQGEQSLTADVSITWSIK
ncbi:MAG: SIMPL domain-containing protein [Proteobacteria bacterium]|nr:SIMPL domain-containing protein [Pseudomonadota bacterium]